MAFEEIRVALVGLLEIEHPAATIRLCDGGFVNWAERGLFTAKDPVYGALGSVEAAVEAVGDEAPAGRLSLLTPAPSAAVSLARADAQGSPIRMWMAEVDPASGLLMGTPEPLFDGEVDTITIALGRGTAEVAIEYVSAAERLFLVKEGNVLSDRFHQLAWPGETGFSQCTGSVTAVPWGVAGPPRGSVNGGSGGFYGGGGGGSFKFTDLFA